MAKFYGKVGYADTSETAPGVWTEVITEREYYGDVLRISRRLQSTDQLNDDIIIDNEFSIISDPFAQQNFHTMRYIEWMGVKWKITKVNVQSPRLILSVGGVYNV